MKIVHQHKITALMRVADYLVQNGVQVSDFLKAQNLPNLSLLDGRLWIDRDHCFSLAGQLQRFTGDPLAACYVAELNGFSAYGRWGEGIRHSRTVGEAIHFAARNVGLFETGRELSLTSVADRARFSTRYLGEVKADPSQYNLASLVIMKRIIDLASEPVAVVVHLPCGSAGRLSDIEHVFGRNLVFDAALPALEFDRDALSLPLKPTNGNHSQSDTLAAFVRSVASCMIEKSRDARPCALSVASNLGVSLRTMQRYLAAWGTTFEEMLSELLMIEAAYSLRSSNSSVTEVAFNLGFSDSAHFTRAFKRWTGLTPREFRHSGKPLTGTCTGVWMNSEGQVQSLKSASL